MAVQEKAIRAFRAALGPAAARKRLRRGDVMLPEIPLSEYRVSSEQDRFYLARQSRRKAAKLLAEQQTLDSKAASDIRDRVLVGQRAILNLLVDFLLAFATREQPSEARRRLFRGIFPDGSLQEWRSYGERHRELEKKLSDKVFACRIATNAYEHKSPLGAFSRVFQDEGEKRVSLALKAEMERLQLEEQSLRTELSSVEGGIRYFTRRFLQSANQTQSLQLLVNSPSEIKNDLTKALTELSVALNELWRCNATAQLHLVGELRALLNQIEEQYKGVEMKRLSGGVL